MQKRDFMLKAGAIRWHRFTRRADAVFRSLGREIVIGRLSVAVLSVACAGNAVAQVAYGEGESAGLGDMERELDAVEVTAARVAVPLGQSARLVSVMTRAEIEDCPAQSVNDLLKLAASVDVRQRGPFGIQTDISLNGGTHDQLLILLNGVNISSPHTGHLAADFPIDIDDIERIEVLDGAASRVYGTSAFSGAINIVTRSLSPNPSPKREGSDDSGSALHGSVKAEGGSYGTFGAGASLAHSAKRLWHGASGGYMRSDGGTANNDFGKWRGWYSGRWQGDDADVNWQLGANGMRYGANTFYSGKYPNQWEADTKLHAAVGGETKGRIAVSPRLYWNRSYDHYQLIKGSSVGENFHRVDVYGLSLNARTSWALGTSVVGAEVRSEGILSTALGKPLEESEQVSIGHGHGNYTKRDHRTNVCYFLEHDAQWGQWTASAGLMANLNTGLDDRIRLYPGIDVSWRGGLHWKVYGSWNMAQRMPTFTDLYYKSPTQEGNVGLKPEQASELALGASYRARAVSVEVKGFHRHERSMIDWVMTAADSVNGYTTYHAANFKLDKLGLNVNGRVRLSDCLKGQKVLEQLSVSYTYIYQKRHDDTPIYASSYALDYLRQKLTARLDLRLWRNLTGSVTYRWQERMGHFVKYTPTTASDGTATYAAQTVDYRPYGLLDVRLQWAARSWTVWAEANNVTNHRYYDLGNVKQAGFWLMSGVKFTF